jgi:hypothetical protein
MGKIKVDEKAIEGWALDESPVAKLASHEVASSACVSAEPEPDSGPDPSVVVPAVSGGESLEDFKLQA